MKFWWMRTAMVLAVVTSCSEDADDPSGTPREEVPAPNFAVDATAFEQRSTVALEDGEPRPLAAVMKADGTAAWFVANELWVSTDDDSAFNDFLSRWNGEVIAEIDAAAEGLDLPHQYLVRVNTSSSDTSRLIQDLRQLDPDGRGEHVVSSDDGLHLIAAAARETADGQSVGLNWVAEGSTFRDRQAPEAPVDAGMSGGYDADAFTWPTHNKDSNQNTGVAEAWRVLELAGKLDNKVKVAILDMGFQPDADTPSGQIAISNVPFHNAIGTENLGGCGDGNPCPWHGQNVLSAAMALPDNAFGAAGSGGPVATPVIVFTNYDFFTSISALIAARAAGAKIANMSYGAGVPAVLSFTVWPFEATTVALNATGMLLFAAAGNDGKNVDAEDCFIVCWEEEWNTPCENAGVRCVGGLGWDSANRAGGSNYGSENVDIFAPYSFWLGPDPDAPNNETQFKSGTSFSSPYAAGIAALIWAADPTLSNDQVWSLMVSTAHSSGDSRVNRIVNALGAVADAVGDASPFLQIQSPTPGAMFTAGSTSVPLSADAEDYEDGTPTVEWFSDQDGLIGTGASTATTTLSLGTHVITATATDAGSNSTSDTVTITITEGAPSVAITTPESGDTFFVSQAIGLNGTSFNPTNLQPLPETGVSWFVNDVLLTTGHTGTITGGSLAIGTHVVRFDGSNSGGTGSTLVGINVVADPPDNVPPTAIITAPSGDANFFADQYNAGLDKYFARVSLCGYGSDPEDGTLDGSDIIWYTRETGSGGIWQIAAAGTSIGLCPLADFYLNDPQDTDHDIRLVVTDSDSAEGERTITIRVYGLI